MSLAAPFMRSVVLLDLLRSFSPVLFALSLSGCAFLWSACLRCVILPQRSFGPLFLPSSAALLASLPSPFSASPPFSPGLALVLSGPWLSLGSTFPFPASCFRLWLTSRVGVCGRFPASSYTPRREWCLCLTLARWALCCRPSLACAWSPHLLVYMTSHDYSSMT